MRHTKFCIGLAAPLVLLLGLTPAFGQQTVPPPSPEGSGMRNPADETRELEREIEAYPGPNDGLKEETGQSDVDSRIPEQINPAPKKSTSSAPRSGNPSSTPGVAAAPRAGGGSSIDPSEVQRVFGSDIDIIALSSLQPEQITRLQVRLRELGHYLGVVDGIAGPQTRAALQGYARAQFALKQRLLQQDQLTTDLAEQLGVQEGPPRDVAPTFRDDPAQPAAPATPPAPNKRRDAPLVPPGAVPMTPPGVTPLPPASGGPPLPTPSSGPAPNRGPNPAAPPAAPPSP
jgi:hypothetical protein